MKSSIKFSLFVVVGLAGAGTYYLSLNGIPKKEKTANIPQTVQQTQASVTLPNKQEAFKRLPVQIEDKPKELVVDRAAQLQAVMRDWRAIKTIRDPDLATQLAAVKQDWHAIKDIKNPHIEVQKVALNTNWHAIDYIADPNKEIQMLASLQDIHVIKHIQNPDIEVQLETVKKFPRAISYIKNPCLEVKLATHTPVYATHRPLAYSANNEHISLSLINDSTVKITNHTDKIITIDLTQEHYAQHNSQLSRFLIPPQSFVTKYLTTPKKVQINSVDETIDYGFSINYTLRDDATPYALNLIQKFHPKALGL